MQANSKRRISRNACLTVFLSLALISPISIQSASAAVNDLASVATPTAAANLLLNGATGITLTGTPTLIASNTSTALKQYTSIGQGTGRQIANPGIFLDSIGSSPSGNAGNTTIRDKLVSVLSAGGYSTTVTQFTALTFQVQADSATTSVSMNYIFASRESCNQDWDVASVLVDNTNYAYLANGKVIRVNPASGNTSIAPTSQFSGITCWSPAQTIVGIFDKSANPPNGAGISTHTITIVVADTGDTAVPSTFMVSMVRGGNETTGGVKLSPVNTVVPVLSVLGGGVARVGQTLSATTGTWSNTPTSYEYIWSSSADNVSFSTIAGETSSTLSITNALRGKYIRATVAGRNASGLGVGAQTLASTLIPLAIVITKFSENLTVNYATAGVDTVTATNGSGTKTFVLQSSPSNAGITIDTATANVAYLMVANNVTAGTYYETITATDIYGETATTSIIVSIQKIAQSPPLTFTLSSSTGKYNDSRTVTMTPSGGAGTGLITYSIATGGSAGTASGCSLANVTSTNSLRSTSIGTCVIVATKAVDDNYLIETSTTRTFTITVADTLTVTSDTPTALTYTGSAAVMTPSLTTVSGLVSGDVISGATYNYSASTASCAEGGLCTIGQTGPGGGLVFITPTTTGNTTGKYFEAAPSGWSGSGTDPTGKYCAVSSLHSGALGTAIGTGQANTIAVASDCVSIADTATALVLNGKNDWFIPSLDELHEMYSKLFKATPTSLGGFTGVNYWSSSDHATTSGYALQGWFGSTDGIVGWGFTDETGNYSYRPVRSFVATSTSTVNYGPSTTKPTNAAIYTITPSALTFSNGATTNYAAITYQTSTLTIDKAAQVILITTPLYFVFHGSPTSATLLTTGGSDTGTITYAYVASGSTASGCALSGAGNSIITTTSAGSCRIVATKAATANYLVAISDTATVTFYLYITNIPETRTQAYPDEIVLSGVTIWTSNGLAPTIDSTGDFTAQSPGGIFTISGTGFVGTRLVKVSGTSAAFTVLSNTSLQITMPSGLVGISGPMYLEKAEGSRASEDWVTGTA